MSPDFPPRGRGANTRLLGDRIRSHLPPLQNDERIAYAEIRHTVVQRGQCIREDAQGKVQGDFVRLRDGLEVEVRWVGGVFYESGVSQVIPREYASAFEIGC